MTESTTTQELVINRIFGAPRELVYRAFTDPDQPAQWFGPLGFSVPRDTVDVDPRPGGYQRFTMVSDDDPRVTSPVNATSTEVIENEPLVGTEQFLKPGVAEPTVMHFRLEFHTRAARPGWSCDRGRTDEMANMTREGWVSSFTKLDALLTK
jgi:uncharacterized protein YndB with AHSA1/START domain